MRALFLLCVAMAPVAQAQTNAIDTAAARIYFEELARLGAADGGRLWGLPFNGPMLFAHAGTRTIVANEADREGLLQRTGSTWSGTLPQSINVANAAVSFGGKRWSMVMWPVADNRYSRGRLISLPDRVAVQLAQYEQNESFVRGFAYASGPAYALLLDAAGIAWRQGLGASGDLAAMAAAAYGIGAVAPDHADAPISRYSGARMIAEERERESRRIASEARLWQRFFDGPVLTLPVAGKFSFSFDPNGAAVLAGAGVVYESSRIADEWGVLEVSSGGVLFLRRADGAFTGIVVAAPSVTSGEIRGDGWNLTLAPGWSAEPREGSSGSFRLVPGT